MDETNLSMLQTVKHDTMSRSLLLPQVIRTLKFPRSLQHLVAHRWTRVRLSRVSTLNHHFEHAGLCIHDQLDSREGSSENISPHFLLRRTHVLQGVRSAVDVPLRKNYQYECGNRSRSEWPYKRAPNKVAHEVHAVLAVCRCAKCLLAVWLHCRVVEEGFHKFLACCPHGCPFGMCV